jgi:hypothetical protein
MMRFLIALLAVVSLIPASAQAAAEDSKANQGRRDNDGAASPGDDRPERGALTYGHSTGVAEDRTTFIANVVAGKSPYAQIELQDPVITVRCNVAWARGVLRAQMKNAAGGTDQNAAGHVELGGVTVAVDAVQRLHVDTATADWGSEYNCNLLGGPYLPHASGRRSEQHDPP